MKEEPSGTVTEAEDSSTATGASMEVEITEPTDNTSADIKPEIVKSAGNESFKENPYTFLPVDDPILTSCMCVCTLKAANTLTHDVI